MMKLDKLTEFELDYGAHQYAEQGLCAMEAVAWLEGEKHSDAPQCACPVISDYVRFVNDLLLDEDRQKLIPYLPKLVGTNTKSIEIERQRAEYLVNTMLTIIPYVENYLKNSPNYVSDSLAYLKNKKYDSVGFYVGKSLYTSRLKGKELIASYFKLLDGVLEIGPKGVFNVDVDERVDAYKELVSS